LSDRFGKIDILVSTIAILGEITPLEQYDEKIWHDVMNTNLTANWQIIKYFHPLLLSSENPSAVFCSCDMSELNNAYWGAYSVSKAALEKLVQIYAEETKNSKIKVSLIDTGPISTPLRLCAFPGKDSKDFKKPEEVADLFVTKTAEHNIIHS